MQDDQYTKVHDCDSKERSVVRSETINYILLREDKSNEDYIKD